MSVFVWSLMTAASGIAQNFWQIFALRLGVGVGEASCAPAATSLIGDLFRASWRAKALASFMLGLPVGVADAAAPPPADLRLSAVAPNPFRAETRFQYQVPAAGRVRLAVYDAQGRCVRELGHDRQAAGPQAAAWDGRTAAGAELPSGVDFLRHEVAGQVTARKIVLQR